MVAWDYDSYTVDDVSEFVEEFKKNQELKKIKEIIPMVN